MYNNRQQPLFPRRATRASSSDSRLPEQPIVAQMASGASSSNNSIPPPAMLAIADLPDRKRRRQTGKTSREQQQALRAPIGVAPRPPDRPQGPTIQILESNMLRSLFQVIMTDFPEGSMGLAPITLCAGPLKPFLNVRSVRVNPSNLRSRSAGRQGNPLTSRTLRSLSTT